MIKIINRNFLPAFIACQLLLFSTIMNAQEFSLRTGLGGTVSVNYFSDDRNKSDALTWFPALGSAGELLLRCRFDNHIFIETGGAKNGISIASNVEIPNVSFGGGSRDIIGLSGFNIPVHLGITTNPNKRFSLAQYIGTAYVSERLGFIPASYSTGTYNGVVTDYTEVWPRFVANHFWMFKTGAIVQLKLSEKHSLYLHTSYSQGFIKVLEMDVYYYLLDGVPYRGKIATNGNNFAFEAGCSRKLGRIKKKGL